MPYCLECRRFGCDHFIKAGKLTKRELDLLQTLIDPNGWSNKQIAFAMGISEGTIKVYMSKVFKKLGWHGTGSARKLIVWTFMNAEKLGIKLPKSEG